jgi:hypothetical protein
MIASLLEPNNEEEQLRKGVENLLRRNEELTQPATLPLTIV